ncbi:MAG: OmpA family protein [Planctomycetota bacterium]|nr:OmpA family protein [Planctomycetota bacterium]
MQTVRLSAIFALCACVLLINGCDGNQDLRIQNQTQQKLINQLQAELETTRLERDRLKNQLDSALQTGDINVQALRQTIAALEEDIAQKNEMIASMQQKLLYGSAALPVELSTMLEDFANQHDMVTYDSSRGIVKFKSDLTFERGSDTVASSAIAAVKTLTGILNSAEARKFDVVVAGHTDDIRIARPETRAKHPTNWHLSVHRAIAVKDVMENSNLEPKRLSVRGFGEYRPIEANLPNKKGNPKNRRVEIFIVAQGT